MYDVARPEIRESTHALILANARACVVRCGLECNRRRLQSAPAEHYSTRLRISSKMLWCPGPLGTRMLCVSR